MASNYHFVSSNFSYDGPRVVYDLITKRDIELDTNEYNQIHRTLIHYEFPINQMGVKSSRTWCVRVNRRILQK
jgi:hypothetical protein